MGCLRALNAIKVPSTLQGLGQGTALGLRSGGDSGRKRRETPEGVRCGGVWEFWASSLKGSILGNLGQNAIRGLSEVKDSVQGVV